MALDPSKTYIIRVQHKGQSLGWSAWSTVNTFATTTVAPFVVAPTIQSPTNNQTGVEAVATPFTFSAFQSQGMTDSPSKMTIQVTLATDTNWENCIVDGEKDYNTTFSTTLPSGSSNDVTNYKARVKYKGQVLGYSEYSTVVSFSIRAHGIVTPTITLNNVDLTTRKPTFTISAWADNDLPGTWASRTLNIEIYDNAQRTGTAVDVITTNGTAVSATGTVALSYGATYYVSGWRTGVINSQTIISGTDTSCTFSVASGIVNAPTVTYPANSSSGIPVDPTITLSAFSTSGATDTPDGTRIEIALSTDPTFTTPVWSYDGTYTQSKQVT